MCTRLPHRPDRYHKQLDVTAPLLKCRTLPELKALLAEDAARRQEATRFQASADDAEDGGANLAPPQFEQGKARAQAARMVTGRASYTTLERIGRLEDLAADESQPEPVRARAAEEVERIKAGGSVYPSHLRVNAELSLAELNQLAADPAQSVEVRERARVEADAVRAAEQEARAAELEQLAKAALARVKAAKASGEKKPARPALTAVNTGEPVPFPLTAFLATWDDMAEWWTHYDPDQLAAELTDEQIAKLPFDLYREGFEYYGKTHAHPNSTFKYTLSSLMDLMSFDATNQLELLNKPLLMIAGSKADTLYMTEQAFARATGTQDKTLFKIDGATHIQTYWVPEYVDTAINQLADFYARTL